MSRIADEINLNTMMRYADRARGVARAPLRFSGSRAADTQVPDITRKAVVPGAQELQHSSGAFYFLLGYSQLGGGDILA